MIEMEIITLPSFWASALINGDISGMSDADIAHFENFMEANHPHWYALDVVEDSDRFTWAYKQYGGDDEGGMVCDYVMHKRSK